MFLLPFNSIYIQPIDLYEMEVGLTVLFMFVHALFFFFLLSPLFLVYFGVLDITFEVGHLGWGCFWDSTMRAIFHTVGNLWMFESHMGRIEMLMKRCGEGCGTWNSHSS